MIVYRISQKKYSEDLSGRGAFLNGGRWNSTGKYALYTSTSRSLALLELLMHLPIQLLRNNDYSILTLELPLFSNFPIINSLDDSKSKGDTILSKENDLYFSVPSIIFKEERNVVLNPLHIDFKKVKVIDNQDLVFDPRLR